MSRFISYNTDDTTAGNPALAGNGTVTIGPIESGGSSKIGGSVFADQAGTLLVQQSFDYFTSGGGPSATPHWDVTQSFAVTANTPVTIDIDVLAPIVQFVYTNGATNQGHLRIFLRVFGPGR